MKRRMLLMLAIVVLFIATIGTVKFMQIRAAIAQGASYQPPPEAVTTIVAREEKWPATLNAIGTVAAVHGVTVSADLPGIVETISFDSGRRVNARQERAQLAAAEAQRELTSLDFERSRQLLQKGVVAQAEYDRIAAEAKQAEARVGEIKATIERKEIRAPFSG